VYAQLLPNKAGFAGGPYLARPLDYDSVHNHLANNYSALCLLVQAGDFTFSGVDKLAMVASLSTH